MSHPGNNTFYYIFDNKDMVRFPNHILEDESISFGVAADAIDDVYTYRKIPTKENIIKNTWPMSTFLVLVNPPVELRTFLTLLDIKIETTDWYKIPVDIIHGLSAYKSVSIRVENEFKSCTIV